MQSEQFGFLDEDIIVYIDTYYMRSYYNSGST